MGELYKTIITVLILLLAGGGLTSGLRIETMAPCLVASKSSHTAVVLLFGMIRIQVEPLRREKLGQGDYDNIVFFERHAENISILAEILERHRRRLTVRALTPFTLMAIGSGKGIVC